MNALEAATKQYVDDEIAAIPESDLTPYLLAAGDTMTGPLVLAADPVNDLEAATKQYVDDAVTGLGDGDFKKDGSVAMTGDL